MMHTLTKLDETDAYIKAQAESILKNLVLVTAHDAFQYFARAYGFEVKVCKVALLQKLAQ